MVDALNLLLTTSLIRNFVTESASEAMVVPQLLLQVIGVVIVSILALLAYLFAQRIYMKMDPPADVDKDGVANPPIVNDNSCWMATAANMLAGAGYGDGDSLQARANDIYDDLVTWKTDAGNPTGLIEGGWTDTALSWWLNSANNTWLNNPYKVVTVYGNKSGAGNLCFPKPPWNNANGAQFIANELRRCQMVGLSISWPTNIPCNDPDHVPDLHAANFPRVGSGGHAITCWGDNGEDEELTNNPGSLIVTDSDRDTGGDIQTYDYDSFTNPNPGRANEGNGWYFNSDINHPYIKHIVTLCPTDDPTDSTLTQKVVGSITIHQGLETPATDMHYIVGTDVDILTYKTTIDWDTENSPEITEDNPRRKLTVDWDLADKPVPQCNDVTITTEFVLPRYNGIVYDKVCFTYPDGVESCISSLRWVIETPILEEAFRIPNVTGGYVVGSFDILNLEQPAEERRVAEYRFVHEYSYDQNPEEHTLLLTGEAGLAVTNVRVGHSYGYPTNQELWMFEDWMTEKLEDVYDLGNDPVTLEIDWKERLPYPPGEDITGRIPGEKNWWDWLRQLWRWLKTRVILRKYR
jgi:hypothetical protein